MTISNYGQELRLPDCIHGWLPQNLRTSKRLDVGNQALLVNGHQHTDDALQALTTRCLRQDTSYPLQRSQFGDKRLYISLSQTLCPGR